MGSGSALTLTRIRGRVDRRKLLDALSTEEELATPDQGDVEDVTPDEIERGDKYTTESEPLEDASQEGCDDGEYDDDWGYDYYVIPEIYADDDCGHIIGSEAYCRICLDELLDEHYGLPHLAKIIAVQIEQCYDERDEQNEIRVALAAYDSYLADLALGEPFWANQTGSASFVSVIQPTDPRFEARWNEICRHQRRREDAERIRERRIKRLIELGWITTPPRDRNAWSELNHAHKRVLIGRGGIQAHDREPRPPRCTFRNKSIHQELVHEAQPELDDYYEGDDDWDDGPLFFGW